MPDKALTLGRAISLWEGSLIASRKAPKTVSAYVRAVTYLEEKHGSDVLPGSLAVEDLEIVAAAWRDLSPTTGRELAHRHVWEAEHGPIPDGLTIDHVQARGCTSKRCLNTAHMELVTRSENSRRRWHPGHLEEVAA